MKKRKWFCLFLSAILLLTGCGSKGNENTGKDLESGISEEERYDFEITEEAPVFSLQSGETILGAQYLDGERIWFLKDGAGQLLCYHEDKGERELLLEHVPAVFTGRNLYMDGENFYAYNLDKLTVLDTEGNEVNTLYPEGRIISLCQSREGSIVLAIESGSGAVLKTLDAEGGTLSGACTISKCVGIGTGTEREILVVDWTGAYDIDMESGEKSWHMKWNGTSYSPRGDRFWLAAGMGKDGILEQIESDGDTYYVVGLKKVNPEEMGKIPLVFRVLNADAGLKQLVAKFNRENKEYHVFLEERVGEYAWDFQARNDMEIATGQGPDLIAEDAVSDMRVLAEKGALENLEPYLEQAGMNREDYHPETFQSQGMADGIYSAGYMMYVESIYIKKELLDSGGQTSIETLLNNMESYGKQAIFNQMLNYTPVNLLRYFFRMSDDFYGMVDWEGKTCDFSGELWEQILRVCGQYGLTERNMEWEEVAGWGSTYNFSDLAWRVRDAGQQGMMQAGYPSEEGMVNELWLDSVAINADSGHKEGAWQFIRFLLEEENQKLVSAEHIMPVHVGALEWSVEEYLYDYYNNTMTSDGGYIIRPELPEGIEEKFWECLANAKPASYRTEQVLAIIEEEAELYFTGDKTVEEISAVIENRVKLYLAEME
ncbi:MAG: extracellular solute-binding protein [Lachnospiraceae bacterium]|nr:extracellular solute-binding protein [Lachnospiraceae bacterium]